MANPTTNFGWVMPTATDLVTDLPADFAVFGQGVDTSMAQLKGGTTGQILSKTSATDMAFTWITNDVGDITAVTAGTGISGGGTSGAVTVTNSMATAITTAGDVIQGTGSGTFARLGIGTAGQVLTVNSGATAVEYATPTSGGMTLISTTTLTGSSVSITVPSGYKNITYVIRDAVAATTSGSYLYQTFNSDTAANYNYVELRGTAASAATTSMTTDAKIYLPYVNNGSDNNMFVANTIYDYLNTSTNKSFNAVMNSKNNSAVRIVGNITGTYFPTTPAAITSIQFAWETSNHSSGTVLLYGVN